MGISEKLEELSKKADMKDRERGEKSLKKLFNYLESCKVEGLKEILSEIKDLSESGLYKKLIKKATDTNKFDPRDDRDFTEEEALRIRILKLAKDNLRIGGLLTTFFTSSMITVKVVASIYVFLESIYYINTAGKLNWNDVLNIYFSGLDERLIFALDKFDTVNFDDLPKPTPEFFQELRKVRWKDRKTKKINSKLEFILRLFVFDKFGFKDGIFNAKQMEVILFLAGCSAVKEKRDKITADDVITAYKTYFKIIKTNISKLIDGEEELVQKNESKGHLVCLKCGGYYKLKSDESPEDFEECQCGGKLKYVENIDEVFEGGDKASDMSKGE